MELCVLAELRIQLQQAGDVEAAFQERTGRYRVGQHLGCLRLTPAQPTAFLWNRCKHLVNFARKVQLSSHAESLMGLLSLINFFG